MTEADYGSSFQIIAQAGDSKGYAMDAIKAAKAGDFVKAEENLKKANQGLLNAHRLQTDMIAQEAGGDQVPVNIILVHSQDHLSMAMTAMDLAEQSIEMYRQIDALKKEIAALK